MKTFALLSAFSLCSCAGNIAGLSLKDRLMVYAMAAQMAGHPEYAPLIYGLRTSAKQPVEITLEGPEP